MTTNEVQTPYGLLAHRLELDTLRLELGEMRQQLNVASCLTARIIESAAEGILIADARRIIRSVNPAFEKSSGYTADEVVGRSTAILKSGHHGKSFYREIWDTLNKVGQWNGEIWNRHKSGEISPEWLSISAVKDVRRSVSNYVGVFSNAHTQGYILDRLHYLAYYDGLTGLPNRRLFLDRLNMSISHARRDKHMLAVMFVDLDQFKQINDTRGHKVGDGLLMGVTERMKSCLRDGDTLARLAGDEFTVIIPILPHPDAATNVAEKFMACYAEPFTIDGHELRITASIGIGIYPNDGEDADSLLHRADIAMYQVKESGKNGFLRSTAAMGMCQFPHSAIS